MICIFGKKKEKTGDEVQKLIEEIRRISNDQKETIKKLEALNEELRKIGRK